jgi:hypothetical protein
MGVRTHARDRGRPGNRPGWEHSFGRPAACRPRRVPNGGGPGVEDRFNPGIWTRSGPGSSCLWSLASSGPGSWSGLMWDGPRAPICDAVPSLWSWLGKKHIRTVRNSRFWSLRRANSGSRRSGTRHLCPGVSPSTPPTSCGPAAPSCTRCWSSTAECRSGSTAVVAADAMISALLPSEQPDTRP